MTTRAKAEARKARASERDKATGVKSRSFSMKREEIPNMVDAIFFGNPEKPGWVEIYVNEKGRQAWEGLFPKAIFKWDKLGIQYAYVGMADWDTFEAHIPDLVEACGQDHMRKVSGGADLHEATASWLPFRFDDRPPMATAQGALV
jgi:hypothetical protein